MKAFTIDRETNNITLHASVEEAEATTNEDRFQTEAHLATLAANWSGARLVEIWNGLPGASPVTRFKDHPTAVNRIWKAIQSLGGQPETAVVPEGAELNVDQPVSPQTPNVAADSAPATPKPRGTTKRPKRATNNQVGASSKTEAVLALLKQRDGATLKAIMAATNWQAHSVRGFISGTLGKKMGLSVHSDKDENGERRYSIPS